MWWVYIPTWVLSAFGVVLAVRSDRRSRASDARSVAADETARNAKAGASSLEVSLQRIADHMEASRIDQQEQIKQIASAAGSFSFTGSANGRRPAPDFNVERLSKAEFRIRNVGTTAATGVTVSAGEYPLTKRMPENVDLAPFASTSTFLIIGVAELPLPGELFVTCIELDEPAVVPLPA